LGIKRVQHHRFGKLWKKLRRGIIEGKAPAFDELHGGDRSDRLRHRGDPE
jgi:hypothetical protein